MLGYFRLSCRRFVTGLYGGGHEARAQIKATFSDGSVATIQTEKGFTHAWQVTGLEGLEACRDHWLGP